jgi:HK97 family phage prohead protease
MTVKLISPSRAQRDLSAIRSRIDTLGGARRDGSVALKAARMVTSTAKDARIAEAIAYGRALAAQTSRRELNLLHLKGGHPELAKPWLDVPSKGHALFEQTRRGVVVDALGRGPGLADSEIHGRTMARLIAMKERATNPLSTRRKTLPVRLSQVKFSGSNGRRIRGFASTRDIDLMGDVVEPKGMVTKLPIALLWAHRHDQPIGTVFSAEIQRDGIWIEADLTQGIALADDALKLIEARAIDAFSIGFLPLESEPLGNGGMRFKKWRMTEVSVVAVPANPAARIARQAKATRGTVRLVK